MPKVCARPDWLGSFRNWLSLYRLTWLDSRQRWPSVQPFWALRVNSESYSVVSVEYV